MINVLFFLYIVGAVYTYLSTDDGLSYFQTQKVLPYNSHNNQHFGRSLSAFGTLFVAGSSWDSFGSDGGTVLKFSIFF